MTADNTQNHPSWAISNKEVTMVRRFAVVAIVVAAFLVLAMPALA